MIRALENLPPRLKPAAVAGALLAVCLGVRLASGFHGGSGGVGMRMLAAAAALGFFVLALQSLYPALRLSRTGLQRVLIGAQLLLGILLVFLLPPFQGPDEIMHWQTAVQLYRGAPENEKILVQLPNLLHASDIPYRTDRKFDPALLRAPVNALPGALPPRVGYANPLSYPFVAVVSAFFPRVQSLPEALAFYYLCRLLPLLGICLLLFWLAGRFDLPFAALWFFSLPLVQQQFFVVNSDTLINFSAVLALVLFVLLWKNFSWRGWIVLGALCLLATYSKVYAGALLLFPLALLPWRRLPYKAATLPALALAAIAAIAGAAIVVAHMLVHSGGANSPADAQAQVSLLATAHGWKFFLIVYRDLLGSIWYISTFASYLGWLDTPLSGHHLFLLRWSCIGALALDAIHYLPRIPPLWRARWKEIFLGTGLSTACFFITSLAICLIMFISWTPPGMAAILGVQARYFFLPLFIVVLMPIFIFDPLPPEGLAAAAWPPLRKAFLAAQAPLHAIGMGVLLFLFSARAVELFVDLTLRYW